MTAEGDQPEDDAARLQRLRRQLFARDADPADPADLRAYAELRTQAAARPAAAATPVMPPEDEHDGEEPAVPESSPITGGPPRVLRSIRARVLLGAAVAVCAVTAVLLLRPGEQSLGPLTAERGRLVPLGSTEVVAEPPESLDASAAAQYFSTVQSTPLEHTTAARKPFFGSGVGATDFALQGYDIGADAVSVTVVTVSGTDVGVTLASGTRLHRVLSAGGRASSRRPVVVESAINGLEAPRVLRIDVAQGTRFSVRAVFLTPIDLGTIDR